MTACKVLAMQAGEENTAKALRAKSDATNLLKCHRAPKPRKSKTKNPNNKKRLNRQEPPKKVLGPEDQRQAIHARQSLLKAFRHRHHKTRAS